MSELEFDQRGAVAQLTLARPEARNALSLTMLEELAAALAAVRDDPEVRVLVLGAQGPAFCAGIDISLIDGGGTGGPGSPLSYKRLLVERIQPLVLALAELPKPVLAAVGGSAVGAGMDIALACDMRLAGRSASFSESYVRLGLAPGAGGCHFLPRLVGRAKALELLLTGEKVDAQEAERLGLVNRVVADEDLPATVAELAERLAAVPPRAVATIKQAAYQSEATDLRTSLAAMSSHVAVLATGADSAEALQAMRERRDPIFKGE